MSSGPEDTRAFRITGRVQGVGFRWWTQRTATDLRIAGTVRNAADGSVEVVASGQPEDLSRFTDALRRGPPGAEVETVKPTVPPDRVAGDAFEIVR